MIQGIHGKGPPIERGRKLLLEVLWHSIEPSYCLIERVVSIDDPKNKKLDGLCLRFYFPYRLPVCHLHRQVRGFGPVAPGLQRLLQSSETALPPGDNLREGCAIL